MDFNDSPEEAAYRAQARTWLEANAPKGPLRGSTVDSEEGLARAREWQARKAAAGYAQITWPKDWGGPGGTPIQQVIFGQEEAAYGLGGSAYFGIGLGMCLPTVMAFADEATKKRFVGPALRGEEIWCQLFSEPAGGSDLGGVRTRAVRDGDDWVVNGQKIWTSGAHYSDYAILITRTNVDAPKHKGMTMFWLDMKSPGVEVRPIHQMSGGSEFNEVFFTDVRIPDSQRLGPVDEGWKVSLVTLMNERNSVGGTMGVAWPEFMAFARETPGASTPTALGDAAVRERLADWYVQTEGLKHIRSRTVTALSKGDTPGPENSITKVVVANQLQALALDAVELLDQYGVISDPQVAPAHAVFQASLLSAAGLRIAGGSDEILRNIIAERVLGLPSDIRLDKNVAFKDIPTGR
jgi:alkylation response protein AidB-like acyl-CoA dehydrogenase